MAQPHSCQLQARLVATAPAADDRTHPKEVEATPTMEMVTAEAAALPAGPLAEAEAEAAETVTPVGRHRGENLMTKGRRPRGEDLPVAILLLLMIRAEDPHQTLDASESSTARTHTRLSRGRRRPTRSLSAHCLPQ